MPTKDAVTLTKQQREIVAQARARGATPGLIAEYHRLDKAAVQQFLESKEGRSRTGAQNRREDRPPVPESRRRSIAGLRARNAMSRVMQLRRQRAAAEAEIPNADSKVRQAIRVRDAAACEDPAVRTAAALLLEEAEANAERHRADVRELTDRLLLAEAEWETRKQDAAAAGARAVEPAA